LAFLGPFLAFVVVTRIEIIVFQRNQIEIGGKKLTVLQKMSYAFCFFSKIVDNILRGGASFEIREIFVGLIKLLTFTALSILLLQEEKNFFRGKF